MRVAVTGGTGLVGQNIALEAVNAGHVVSVLVRKQPPDGLLPAAVSWQLFDLNDSTCQDLSGFDALVHCAFDHIPGRYRGGEGSDPVGFKRRNLDGSKRVVAAAEAQACRVVFLSSRAVYGTYPSGTKLTEDMTATPDTLYGEVKLQVEAAVTEAGGTSLRATGIYGAPGIGQRHKWADLFEDFAQGREIAPRKATEVHGADLAAACLLALNPGAPAILNVSDLMLDRCDLLSIWSEVSGQTGQMPERVVGSGPAEMDCERLRSLGWEPCGIAGLRKTLVEIAQPGARSTA